MSEPIDIIYRIDRCTDGITASQDYVVPVQPGMTVLEGLLYIQKEQDPTLSWRYSCRMGICGACGLTINGRPGLACNTQILEVSDSLVHLGPLTNFPVVKDLFVDTASMFQKHSDLKPYITANDSAKAIPEDHEYEQSPEELLSYQQFADCIKCGACMSACPTLATDDRFAGPMPLASMHRYNNDTRDSGFSDRAEALAMYSDPGHCHYAAECSSVCPRGVDPARAIQLLKRSLVADQLHLRRQPRARFLPPGEPKQNDDIPAPPAPTVGED